VPRGPSSGQRVLNINNTLIFLTLLAAATAIGLLSTIVYEQCTKGETRATARSRTANVEFGCGRANKSASG
jgi:hypothetical protein